MKIWHLFRTDKIGYDEVREMVVMAETASKARQLAGLYRGDEDILAWHNPDRSKCRGIGEGLAKRSKIIVRDKLEG